MVTEKQLANLIKPKQDQTASERREAARKAGKASGKARAAKKPYKEMAQELSADKRKLLFDALIDKAAEGSLPHFELYLELAGEHPKQEPQVKTEPIEVRIDGGEDYAD